MITLETRRLEGRRICILAVAFAAALVCGGCQRQARFAPGPEETTTRFLRDEVEEALAAVESATKSMSKDPDAARAALSDAQLALLALDEYYLPLLEARGFAQNALRWYRMGQSTRSLDALRDIEAILLKLSDRRDSQLSRELDGPLERAVAAQAALRAGRDDAPQLLGTLSTEINMLLLKGGLALQGTHLEGS